MMTHTQMLFLMFVAGIFSSMSVWADKVSDVRISVNDVYMALLMCAWMLLLMGAWMREWHMSLWGILSIGIMLYLIRNQIWIGPTQYATSMIPHHSMAIMMSKRLAEKYNLSSLPLLQELVRNIIQTQEEEIYTLQKIESKRR